MIDFIVLGLSRSGTTWLSNWLTTDQSFCLHDPLAWGFPEEWEPQWRTEGKRFGVSCTGLYLFPAMIPTGCPVAIIERDTDDCDASLAGLGLPPLSDRMRTDFQAVAGRRFRFDDVWDEATARDLWAFLLPGIPFDAPRYRQLCEFQVQPHVGKLHPRLDVIVQLAQE